MTLMFIRHFYGSESYMAQIEKCRTEYNTIKGTPQDEAIVNMVENNNNTIVYKKGPLVLDCIANEIGYDELTESHIQILSGIRRKASSEIYILYRPTQ